MPLESHGTQQFIRVYPAIRGALLTGGIAVVDELDVAIHPSVLPEILRWFADQARNPHGAQLWMSCHSVSLLDDLIKEEILICEKNAGGATHIYGLSDIQGIRRGRELPAELSWWRAKRSSADRMRSTPCQDETDTFLPRLRGRE